MIQRSVLRTVFKHRLLSNVIITLQNKKPKEFTTEICLKKHQTHKIKSRLIVHTKNNYPTGVAMRP